MGQDDGIEDHHRQTLKNETTAAEETGLSRGKTRYAGGATVILPVVLGTY